MPSSNRPEAVELQAMIDAAGAMIISCEPDGMVRCFNPAAERLLGWTAREVVGKVTPILWHDAAEIASLAHQLSDQLGRTVQPGFEVLTVGIEEPQSQRREWTFVRKDGSRVPVLLTMTARRDELGKIQGYVGTALDQSLSVEALQERDRFFNLSLDVFCIASNDGYFKRINPAFERTLGWNRNELLDRPLMEFVHPEDQSATLREIERQVVAGETVLHFENRYLHRDGSWRILSWRSVPQPGGLMYATARDVTEERSAAEALRHSEQNLAITLNSIGDAVIATDAQRRITRMNPVAEHLTGWSLAEATGQPIERVFHIIHEETRLPALIPVDDVLATGNIHGLANHTVLISRDGTEWPIADSAAPIRDVVGDITGVVLVFRDVSDERQFQRKLERLNDDLERHVGIRTQELARRESRLRNGNRILEMLTSDASLEETLALIAQVVEAESPSSMCSILTLDESGKRLLPGASPSLPEFFHEALTSMEIDDHAGSSVTAIRLRQRVISEDLTTDPGWVSLRPLADRAGLRSCWSEPLVSSDGRVLGVLALYHRVASLPDDDDNERIRWGTGFAQLAVERKQAQAALRASEQRYRQLLNEIPAPVFVYDRETLAYLTVSDVAVAEYGYSRDEFMQMTIADIRPADDLPQLKNMLAKSGTEFENRGVWRHRFKDGTLRDMDITTRGLEVGGRPACIVLANDVTEQLQTQTALREGEALMRSILEASLDCIITMNEAGEIVEFNPAAEKVFGYSRDEVLGRTVKQLLIPPELRERHSQGLARFISTGKGELIGRRIVTEALRSDGQTFPVEMAIVRVPMRGHQMFTAFLRDVTEQIRSEKELRRTTDLLQAVADGTPDAVFLKDRAGRYLLFNKAAARFAGRPADEVLGQDDRFVFGTDAGREIMENDALVMEQNQPQTVEDDLTVAGVTRTFHTTKAPFLDAAGNVAGIIGIARDVTEKKRIAKELEETRAFAVTVIENVSGLFYVLDQNGVFVRWNRAMQDLLGYSYEEMQQTTALSIIDEADREKIADRMAEVFTTGQAEDEARLLLRDGVRHYLLNGRRLDINGAIYLVGSGVDISQRIEAEQRLQYSEERFRVIAQTSNDAIWDWDLKTDAVWWSESFSKQFGWRRDEVGDTSESWTRYIHPDDKLDVISSIRQAIEHGPDEWQHEYRFQHKSGHWLYVIDRGSIIRDSHGRPVRMYGGMTDLTARKEAEHALARLNEDLERRIEDRTAQLSESERFNRATLDALSSHVAVLEPDGTIITVNQAWKDFAERNAVSVQTVSEGSNYLDVCDRAASTGEHDAAATAIALRQLIAGEIQNWDHDYSCHSPLESRWFHCHATRFLHDGHPRVLVAHENVTAMKLTEEALRSAKGLAEKASNAKSEFLATMSHELRTPLNGILGMNALLLSSALSDKQRQFVELSSASGKLLLQLVNDILDLSKIEAGKLDLDPREGNLEAFTYGIVDILSHVANEKGLTLTCRLATDACVVGMFDDARLQQILVNLVGNAIKFTSSGGITISVDRVSESAKTVRLRFAVSDTGVGIPQERIHRLFKAFSQVDSSTTRQYGGTGLGLSICRQLVELMGGTIGVESHVGVGTTFWFEIDIPTPTDIPATRHGLRLLAGTRFVAIDGLDRDRSQVAECLRSWHCPFQQAATVSEALDMVRHAGTANSPVQIVLVDCRVVDRVSFAQLQELAAHPSLEIIALGTPADVACRDQLHQIGVRHILPDPIRPSVLFDTLATLLSVNTGSAVDETDVVSPETLTEQLSGHILVAEDNRINQLYIVEMLRNFGCTSDLAENGEEALAHVQRHRYDLVLMDCQMPEMDGLAAAYEIRKRESSGQLSGRIPIVALTANALKGDRQQCLDAGMDDYLAKPVESSVLRAVLQRHLHRQ